MRALLWLSLIVACGGGSDVPDDVLEPIPEPVVGDDWDQPTAAQTWQWQLLGTVNTSYNVDYYDIDLYDVPDATLQALRSDDRKIICYFSAGSHEDWRDDQADFPDAVIGKKLDGWPGERWLDVRDARVLELMAKRLDVAVARGCHMVEPDNVDGFQNNTGFDLSPADQLLFLQHLANAAHERKLGILLKNGADIVADAEPWFDGAVVEQCAEYAECDRWAPFLSADKAVFQAEYSKADTAAEAEALADEVCPDAVSNNRRALVLPLDLNDAFRVDCDQR
ncbi:MAG: endo alpha-1,4 polygalactosaminidase [Myxococcota bacterium]